MPLPVEPASFSSSLPSEVLVQLDTGVFPLARAWGQDSPSGLKARERHLSLEELEDPGACPIVPISRA